MKFAPLFAALFAVAAGIGYFFHSPIAPIAGATLPSATAVFETSLQSPITSSASSMTLAANAVRGGGAVSGYNCFTVDEGSAQAETICGTVSGTAVSSLTRGISQANGTSTVAALQFSHRRGANIKITDFPILQIMKAVLNGEDTLPSGLTYASAPTVASSSAQLPPASWIYNNFVNLSVDQTVNGAKTFTGALVGNSTLNIAGAFTFSAAATNAITGTTTVAYTCGAFSANTVLCPKSYIDSVVSAGASDANTTTKGLAEEATAAEVLAGTAAGSAGRLFVNPSSLVGGLATTSLSFGYRTSSASTDIYQAVSMTAGDVLFVWAKARNNGTDFGGSVCSGAGFSSSLIVKQSTFAASSTVDFASSQGTSGNGGCPLVMFYNAVATTTETWEIRLDHGSITDNFSLMYQVFRQ